MDVDAFLPAANRLLPLYPEGNGPATEQRNFLSLDHIRALYDAGSTARDIAQKLGLGHRRVYRWVRRIDLPERNAMAPKPCTPAYAPDVVDGSDRLRRAIKARHQAEAAVAVARQATTDITLSVGPC